MGQYILACIIQGCQMVCLQTKNSNLGELWRVLQYTMMVYFMDTWSILRSFVIFYVYLVQFVVIWYIFPVLVFSTKKNLATLVLSRHENCFSCARRVDA
jgi:hypothetical protein